jgi:hypothetical protein
VQISGIVRGSSKSAQLTASKTSVYPVNLTAEVTSQTKNQTTFEITVVSVSGIPQKQGALKVESQKSGAKKGINLTKAHNNGRANNGRVSVTLPEGYIQKINIRYRPTELWWEQNLRYGSGMTAMARTTTTQWVGGGFPAFKHLIELVVVTLLFLGPMLGMLYFVDVLTNGRLIGVYSR